MGLRPAKSHEKLVLQDWWGGPPGRGALWAGVPRPALRLADQATAAGRRGRRPRTRGSAPPFVRNGPLDPTRAFYLSANFLPASRLSKFRMALNTRK